MNYLTILAVGSGGFIGAVLRVYFNGLISHKLPHTLPLGTLGVNLIGSFIMGFLVSYFMYSNSISLHTKSFLLTGILGALTTYSTFAIESLLLLQGGHFFLAASNIILNSLGTVAIAGLGFYVAKFF